MVNNNKFKLVSLRNDLDNTLYKTLKNTLKNTLYNTLNTALYYFFDDSLEGALRNKIKKVVDKNN